MANDVKWHYSSSNETERHQAASASPPPVVARLQLLLCAIGVVGLAVALPGPRSWPALLAGLQTGTTAARSVDATAEQAILVTAGLLVWAVLAWTIAVVLAALAARLPGAPGRLGRSLLRRIAPGTANRVVAAAVGISVLTGTSACAVPALTAPGAGGSGPAGSAPMTRTGSASPVNLTPTASASTASGQPTPAPATDQSLSPVPTADGTPAGAVVVGSITIDWPDPPPPADVPAEPVPAAPARAPDAAPPGAPMTIADSPVTTADSTGPQSDPAAPPGPQSDPAAPAGPPGVTGQDPVTVLPGDTLWSIARRQLPPDAGAADIDTAWRAWYAANTSVIGDDPDVIQPGQHLLPPEAESGR